MVDDADKMRAALPPEVRELARQAFGQTAIVLETAQADTALSNAAAELIADRANAQTLLSEISSLPVAAQSILGAEITALKTVLTSRASKTQRVDINGIRAAIATAVATAEVSAHMETPQQKAERLWQEIKAINTEIKADIEQLHRDRFVSDEAYEQYKKERARIDAMDNNDPAKPIADKALNEWVQEIAKQAGKAAQEQGNHESHATATHMGKKAEEAVKANEALDALSQTHKEEVTTNIDAVKAKYSVNDTSLDDILAGGTPTLPTPINSKGKAGRES